MAGQLSRLQLPLSKGPEWLVDDLTLLYERELDGWTKPRWLMTTCAFASLGGALAVQRIVEATTQRESLLGPITILFVYVAALGVVSAVGVARVRAIRRELSALRNVRAELCGHSLQRATCESHYRLLELRRSTK